MSKAKRYFGALALVSGAALSLVACGNNKNAKTNDAADTHHKFSQTVPVKSVKKGGTLNYQDKKGYSQSTINTRLTIKVLLPLSLTVKPRP